MPTPPQAATMKSCFADADWYDAPHLYDVIFRDGTEQERAFLEAMVLRYGLQRTGQRVLEPACGSGRLVEAMARRGHEVWGFDLNEQMIAYAKKRMGKRAPPQQIRLWVDDMSKFCAPAHFTLVHTLVSTFKYLPDNASAVSFMKKVAEALLPGGLFVLGLHMTQYQRPRRTVERWFGREKELEVICKIDSWPASEATRTEAMRCRLTGIANGAKRRLETHWLFRTYDSQQVKELLAQVPTFELVACHDFHHDSGRCRALDTPQSDLVLVLRRIRESPRPKLS